MVNNYNVLGVKINAVSKTDAMQLVIERVHAGGGGYVCFSNVHTTVMGAKSQSYKDVLNSSFLTLPDGKPVYWVGVLKKMSCAEHLPGPDFMLEMLAAKQERPLRHYFLGGTPEVLKSLVEKVRAEYKDAKLVGWESPPFRPLSTDEIEGTIKRINSSRPDLVWVGLGAPKQEKWMNEFAEKLAPAILFGVGAAFDFHAQAKKRAPKFMRACGMEWFYRLMQEPRRLFSRYLVTNSLFVWLLMKERLALTTRPTGSEQ